MPRDAAGDSLMPAKLKWTDSEDLAELLHAARPTVDPLTVRFMDLRDWVTALPEFGDDPKASNEAKLEALQMAWLEVYRDAQGA
jgi:FeS assembly protein IscX